MWNVYILKCRDNSLYIGSTIDISRRINEHNSGKGGNYTRGRRPVKLVHKETYPTRSSAQKREAEIKGLTKVEKLDLIHK